MAFVDAQDVGAEPHGEEVFVVLRGRSANPASGRHAVEGDEHSRVGLAMPCQMGMHRQGEFVFFVGEVGVCTRRSEMLPAAGLKCCHPQPEPGAPIGDAQYGQSGSPQTLGKAERLKREKAERAARKDALRVTLPKGTPDALWATADKEEAKQNWKVAEDALRAFALTAADADRKNQATFWIADRKNQATFWIGASRAAGPLPC